MLLKKLVNLSIDAGFSVQQQFFSGPDLKELEVILEGDNALNNLMLRIQALSKASINARKDWYHVKQGDKQRYNVVRKWCVGELGIAWLILTGERPKRRTHGLDSGEPGIPYGPFHDFVLTALAPLFGPEDTEKGIDAVIKDVVHAMENNPDGFRCVYFHI